jgi:carboxymethylenebutenolidase
MGKIPAADGAPATEALKASTRHGEWVDVDLPDSPTKLKSWIVYPERPDKAGVVVVIFDIFGMGDWVRGVTDQLAADGFIAICPDLLSGLTEAGGDARGSMGKVTADEQEKRLNAARAYAIAQPSANGKSACIGFCWGGTASFLYATKQPKLNAAVVCYGQAPMKGQTIDKDMLAKIQCPVLGCYGGSDARITSTVEATKTAMQELNKSYTPNIYEGAGHGFFRNQLPNAANLKAAQQGWPTAIEFLKKNLG